jgi:HD superfamily phosphodiesterase
MQLEPAKAFILEKQKKEFPGHLRYHSVDHVMDVYTASKRIALAEGITEPDLTLLLTAALFHDSGFTIDAKNHEENSCVIAKEILPQYGYNNEQLEIICAMIMATRIPQQPKTILEKIICDADLDYLGRDDFYSIGAKLFEELKTFGVVQTHEQWNNLQVKFLEQHHFFTPTSIETRKSRKDQYLSILKSKYNQ